jgi:hypothetical protein
MVISLMTVNGDRLWRGFAVRIWGSFAVAIVRDSISVII